MAIDFPNSPANDDVYVVGNRSWVYISSLGAWSLQSSSGLGPNTVTAVEIASGAVTAAKIASDAVTEVKILNGNVTAAKLAANVASDNLGFTPASTGKAIAMSIVFGG